MKGTASIQQELLEKSLQSMIETEDGRVRGVFSFSPDFPAFEGHFPSQPVLPAVVQVAAVRLLAARHLDVKLIPVSLNRSKFKAMVGPNEPMTITISLDQSGNDVTISFSITSETKKIATGEIVCRS
jgi:3-hydroxyacyl-[acyl-carrier-protein] dehydratase